MNLRLTLIMLACLLMLSGCGGNIRKQGEIETITLTAPNEATDKNLYESSNEEQVSANNSSDNEPISERMGVLEYLPEVFPEWCRDDIVPESTYVRAALTDGNVIIVPDMKLTDLPLSFQEALICSERDNIYGERAGTYTDQEAQDVFYAVYQTDDLKIMTMYYNPSLTAQYEDAGIEYIREVIALSDKFCTYQGARLGESSVRFLGYVRESWQSMGTPYMDYSIENNVITGLRSCAFSEISFVKYQEIELLKHREE